MDHLCYFCLVLLCFHVRLFMDALWSPETIFKKFEKCCVSSGIECILNFKLLEILLLNI